MSVLSFVEKMEEVNHLTYITMCSSSRVDQVECFLFHSRAEDAGLLIC